MNWMSKRVLPTPALETADPALTLAYRLWSDRRVEGYLPARCQLDTPQFRLVIPQVQWLDVSDGPISQTPKLDGFGDAVVAEQRGSDKEITLSAALLDDLRLTQFTGSPLFQLVELAQGQETSTLQLLFLPFADDGLSVGEILVIARLAPFSMDLDTLEDEASMI